MKIAIIGGGWVGCHLANKFLNTHEVTLFEKNESVFNETSYNNQNRLHLGFHYARNFKTRKLCKDTFNRFLDDYGFLTNEVVNNLYCVPKKESIIDYETYLQIFKGFDFNNHKINLNNIDGCISTGERYINFEKSKKFFSDILKNNIIIKNITNKDLNHLSKKYDLVINCTNNNLKIKKLDSFFELTISLLYKKTKDLEFGGLTMVDGELFSIYPYRQDVFTVTDVVNTPIKKFKSISSLNNFKKNINDEHVNKIKLNIEKKISHYYPHFINDFS